MEDWRDYFGAFNDNEEQFENCEDKEDAEEGLSEGSEFTIDDEE